MMVVGGVVGLGQRFHGQMGVDHDIGLGTGDLLGPQLALDLELISHGAGSGCGM